MTTRHVAALFALLFTLTAIPAAAAPDALAAMKSIVAQTDKYRSMMANFSTSQFHLAQVPASESRAVAALVKKDASDVAGLRETLAATTMVNSQDIITSLPVFLKPNGVTVDRIVAVSVGGNGQITLFYL